MPWLSMSFLRSKVFSGWQSTCRSRGCIKSCSMRFKIGSAVSDCSRLGFFSYSLRQRLHARFDQWLDQLEAALPEGAPTLGQVSEIIWAIRQQLTGGVAETIVHHTHR